MYYLRYSQRGQIHLVREKDTDTPVCEKTFAWLDDGTRHYDPIYLPVTLTVYQVLSHLDIRSDHRDEVRVYLNDRRYNDQINAIHFNAQSMKEQSLSEERVKVIATAYDKQKWSLITSENELEENPDRLAGALRHFLLDKEILGKDQMKFEQINFCGTCMSHLFGDYSYLLD